MALRLDFTNMIAAGTGSRSGSSDSRAIGTGEWAEASAGFPKVHAAVEAERARGTLGFFDLPADKALHEQVTSFVRQAEGKYTDVVVLGIGGSALGPIALRTSLRASGWNALDAGGRAGKPALHVLDNVDPITMAALLDRLELRKTLFITISKSGGTAETMAQYMIVRDRLTKELGEAGKKQLVFVTDPTKGALRAIAKADGVPALEIPSNVGGRFSVLTPVGLLPAALMGVDTAAMLEGAGAMAERCSKPDPASNPAAAFALLQWLADTRHGLNTHVMMPYSDALRDFAAWFVQLWAESLGKIRPDGTSVGPTPLPALGATDQHSQVQLFMEGPANKTVTFLAVKEPSGDLPIPKLHGDIPELAYLGGHTLGELLDIERRATAGALAKRGRPNMTLTLDRVDAWHVGGMIMLFEIATVYAGALYGVNPMDQPGVELGKQFTYAMMGRADAEAARKEFAELPTTDARWTV